MLDLEQTFTSNSSTKSYSEYALSQTIWKYCSPVIMTVGTIGSVLTILVLGRKPLKQKTTMFYLTVLAFADLAVLYTGLLRLWLEKVYAVKFRLYSSFSCKFHAFVVYFALNFSVWILVAVTVDRCVFVLSPTAPSRWCTLLVARRVVVVVAVIDILFNIHLLWTVERIYKGTYTISGDDKWACDYKNDSDLNFSVEKVWPWLDFTVIIFFPFLIMLMCDCLIIRHLVVSARNLRAHRQSDADCENPQRWSVASAFSTMQSFARQIRNRKVEADDICHKQEAKKEDTTSEQDCCEKPSTLFVSSTDITESKAVRHVPQSVRQRSSERSALKPSSVADSGNKKRNEFRNEEACCELSLHNPDDTFTPGLSPPRDQPRVNEIISSGLKYGSNSEPGKLYGIPNNTLVLLTVTSLFWLLTAPLVIYLICYPYWNSGSSDHTKAILELAWAIVNTLFYTNNAMHFFMYCLTGHRFRQEMMAMFRSVTGHT